MIIFNDKSPIFYGLVLIIFHINMALLFISYTKAICCEAGSVPST